MADETAPAHNTPAGSRVGVLLSTKLLIPPARPELVLRLRLLERLSAVFNHRLTLVIAPAGFGKTTLLSTWLASLAQKHVAWLALDDLDNDPSRFWSYLIAALDPQLPGAGDHALAMLRSPQPPPIEVVLAALLEEFSAAPVPIVVILDDYHTITNPLIHAAMSFFIDHLPVRLRLVIASRNDPPLPLARWRVRGELAELRGVDLSFTAEETIGLLNSVMGLEIAPQDAAALAARTEGWVAALHLAALSLRGRSDRAAFIASFAGSNRYLVDYLAGEVLRFQSAELQDFLLRTSILDEMCAELCDAVLDGEAPPTVHRPPSTVLLAELERASLFVVPLDDERRWYRYHRLFAEFLRTRLREALPEVLPELHLRAARWYVQRGYVTEAIAHALEGDGAFAAQLVEEYARPLLLRSEVATVLGWIDALPAQVVRERPAISLISAWAMALGGRFDEVEPHLRDAEQALERDPSADEDSPWALYRPYSRRNFRSELIAVRATVAGLQRDIPRTIALARQALELMPADSTQVRGVVALMLGSAFYLSGDCTAATQAFQEAAVAGRAGRNIIILMFALHQLGLLQRQQGRLHQAERTFRQALDEALVYYPPRPGRNEHLIPVAGTVYVGLGCLAYERNDLATAERYFADGVRLGRQGQNIEILLMGPIYQARTHVARGANIAAAEVIQDAIKLARQTGVARLVDWMLAEQARILLMQGRLEESSAWAEASDYSGRPYRLDDQPGYLREIDYLALAQVAAARGQAEAALPLLEHLLHNAEAQQRFGSVIEIRAVQALALAACNREAEALVTLDVALTMAAPEGYLRTFADLGEPMRLLLNADYRARSPEPRKYAERLVYLRHLLAAFGVQNTATQSAGEAPPMPRPYTADLVEPLSERELEVLRLIAAGLSNQAIADRLVVGLSTVKKHINNAYAKLQVASRTQALVRARELGLIE